MESEELTITIDGDEALFVGHFTFRSAPSASDHVPDATANLEIPIWVPAKAHGSGSVLVKFLTAFPTMRLAWITDGNRALVNELIGLSVDANGEAIGYETFSPFAYDEAGGRIPKTWMRPGAICLYFRMDVVPSLITDGGKVTITYRQPLIHEGDRRILFYVPIFRNLDSTMIERNREKYRVTVESRSDVVLKPIGRMQLHQTPRPNLLVIVPQHEQAITVVIEEAGKASKTKVDPPPPHTSP